LIASFLAQFYRAAARPVKCIDTDPVNQTFSQYAAIGAKHLRLMDGNQVNRRHFDDMIEDIVASDDSFVVDNGAATFIPLWHYMVENSMAQVFREKNRRLVIHTVLTGSQALTDTLSGFKSIAESSDERNIVVWVNEYFGNVRRDGKEFTDMAVYQEYKDRVAGIVFLHKRSPDTFGRDIEEMISRKLTFAETLQAEDLTLMSKQRLRMVQRETFEQLRELKLFRNPKEIIFVRDIRELIGKVASRNNVRVDEDDPIFAVSTINLLMLQEAIEPMAERFRAIVQEFEKSARLIDERAGKLFADEVRRSATAWRDQIKDDIKAASLQSERMVKSVALTYSRNQMIIWVVTGVASGAVLFASGVAVGHFWR